MKILILLSALVAVGVSQAYPEAADRQAFFKELKYRLERIVPKKAPSDVEGNVTAEDLYWKGVKSERRVGEEELEKFRAAVELALQGKDAEATDAFEVFLRLFPDSVLKKDAEDSFGLLKAGE